MSLAQISKLTLPISHMQDQDDPDPDPDQDDDGDGMGEDDEMEASPLDYKTPEEMMTPMERIIKCYTSDNMMDRENSAKELGDASSFLKPDQPEELKQFVEIIHSLATDQELYVRQIVAEQVGAILLTLQLDTHSSDEYLTLLDALVQFCSDSDQKVRHNNHSSILSLINQAKYKDDITRLCCETIKKLSSNDAPFQIKADAILLLSRIAVNIDSHLLVEEFSNLFQDFTHDTMHDVRRAFAYACKELCPVLGIEYTEKWLVSLFLHLCSDDFWSVRKACCEVFDKVSGSCGPATRENELTDNFLKLLSDNSRWVRKAAFESLGPFLSTFYNPNFVEETFASPDIREADTVEGGEEQEGEGSVEVEMNPLIFVTSSEPEPTQETQVAENEKEDDLTFTQFNYWRDPYFAVEESDLQDIHTHYPVSYPPKEKSEVSDEEGLEDPFAEREDSGADYQDFDQSWDFQKCLKQTEDNVDMSLELSIDDPIPSQVYTQTRVPSKLLVEYLLMVDQKKIQHVDTDLPMKCAYSLPGVAITLGKANWSCLKSLYINLASELQWKIRRCLACSLHCLAGIYGPETAATDLVTVFDTFLKDIDEVKSGVISHIGEFLEFLPREVFLKYGPILPSLKSPDNKNNWRYRLAYTEQLISLVKLFPLEKSIEYFQPVMIDLGHDQVAEVRDSASKIMVFMLNYVTQEEDGDYFDRLVELILSQFAAQQKWLFRLQFVKICRLILEDGRISKEVFLENFMPDLLTLAKDKVPNVRLTTGRLLYKLSNERDWKLLLEDTTGFSRTMELLKEDNDPDVRGSVGQERYAVKSRIDTGVDMVSSSLSMASRDYSEDHSITDSLSLMNIKPISNLEEYPQAPGQELPVDDEEIAGHMDLDEPTILLKIISPDSTSGHGDELEGLLLPIGGDEILTGMSKFMAPISMLGDENSPPESQEVDMDIEDLEALSDPAEKFSDQVPTEVASSSVIHNEAADAESSC